MAEANLEKHKAKCPSYQLWLAERARPFFCQGINGGPPEEEVAWPPGLAPLAPPAPPPEAAANEADAAAEAAGAARKKQRARKARPAQGAAGLAAAYAASLGPERFEELLRRIEAACEQVRGCGWCEGNNGAVWPHFLRPPAPCRPDPASPSLPAAPAAGVRGGATAGGGAARGGAAAAARERHPQPPLLAQARAAAGGGGRRRQEGGSGLLQASGARCASSRRAVLAASGVSLVRRSPALIWPPRPSAQASIVGNMKAAGLLAGAEATTYIEFGAGKGYLW